MIFDSRAAIGTGQGVYMEALAGELAGTDLETGIEVYSEHSLACFMPLSIWIRNRRMIT